MNHLLIIGFGLMGGSVALAARDAFAGVAITVVDPSPAHRAYAREHGIAQTAFETLDAAPPAPDVVVIAAPVRHIGRLAAAALQRTSWKGPVTDIGSVKRLPVQEVLTLMPDTRRFVPAHPIAGSEKTGPEGASAALLRNRRCILTPTQAEEGAVQAIQHFWHALGMTTDIMTPELHDRIYALVSHLPQKLAFDYADRMADSGISEAEHTPHALDFLRLTRSNRALWADIFTANADYLEEEYQHFQRLLAARYPQMVSPSVQDLRSGRYGQALGRTLLSLLSARSERLQCPLQRYAGTGLQSFTSLAHSTLQEPSP